MMVVVAEEVVQRVKMKCGHNRGGGGSGDDGGGAERMIITF